MIKELAHALNCSRPCFFGVVAWQLVAIRQSLKGGEEDEHRRLTAAYYGRLRLAWERCIEEVLLNAAV